MRAGSLPPTEGMPPQLTGFASLRGRRSSLPDAHPGNPGGP